MNTFTLSLRKYALLFGLLIFTNYLFSQTADYNVQHLQDDVARTGGTNTGFTTVSSINNAVALANNNRKTHAGFNGSGSNYDSDDLSGARRLTSTGTLTYYRDSGSSTNNARFNSSIWEYVGPPGGNNEMIVRGRYIVNLNGGTNSVAQAISGITNANDCIPFITGIMNNSTNDDADSGTAIAYLESAATLRVLKGSNANNVTVYITLVEFTGSNWTVLHGDSGNNASDTGTITLRNGSDGTGTPTNVSAWSDSVIFSHHIGDTGASGANDAIADNWPVMDPGSNNQRVDWTFDGNHDSAGTNRHFVHVLSNTSMNVTRYQDAASAPNETTINIASAGLSSINEALIIGSSRSSGTGTAYARGWRNYYLNSTTQAAHWAHRSGNSMSHEIQIVDLSGLTTAVAGPEINITGLGNTINDGDTTPNVTDDTDFGSTDVAAGTIINTFTIQNTGTTTLNLTGSSPYVVVSGTHAADFTVTTTPSNSIVSSGSTTFNITFNPSAAGLRTATLTIANDDSNENPYNFDIEGTGTVASYCISNGNTSFNTGTSYVSFNTLTNSDTVNNDNAYEDYTGMSTTVMQSTAYNLTVNANTDGNYTTHTWVWIDWNQDSDFLDAGEAYDLGTTTNNTNGATTLSPLSITIPGTATLGTTRMRVATRYNTDPTSCGTGYDGEVEDYSINVIAGTPQPEIDITGLGNTINDNDATPSTLDDTDWGNVNLGTPTPHTFTINNIGTANLNLTGIAPYVVIGGANPSDFAVTTIPTPNIAAAGSTTFGITFTPTAIGPRTATLSIANNDASENPYNFRIQGTGFLPAPEIDVTGLGTSIVDGDATPSTVDDTDFGTSDIGSPIAHTFTINNSGTINLNIGAITFSGANPGDFSVTTAPAANIAASGSTTFVVTFNPSAAGGRSATLSIANNDSDENPYNFSLQGQGAYPPPQYAAYYETFDASNGGWTLITSTNDSWVWTNSFPTTELGDGSFWRNNNFNNYSNNTNIVIQSPQYDFSGLQNLQLSIDIKNRTESAFDGMRILYSVAGGPFTLLGASGSGINWYGGNVSALGTDGWSGDVHTQNPTFNPHNQFQKSTIELADGTFSNQNNVRFRIEFQSEGSGTDDGVGFDNVLIQADPIVALNDASVAPANITSNLRLWLKANEGISVSDGAALTAWEDQAYDTALDKEDASMISSTAPTYRDNGTRNINYNPVADFDHNNTEYMQGKGGFFAQDYFVVVKSDDIVDTQTGGFSPGRQIALGGRFSSVAFHEDPTGLGLGSTSARYDNEIIAHNIDSYPNGATAAPDEDSYGRAYTSATDSYNHVLIVNVKSNAARTAAEIYKNGKRVDNATGTAGNGDDLNFYEFQNLQYLVGAGRSGYAGRTTSQLNGRLGEIVSYNTPNSSLNQQKIQSYLGIKYGVTLQAPTSALTDYRLNDVDYIDSNGDVIWDTSDNTAHNYDVAGIGRDDRSILNQKQSVSQNIETDIDGPTSGFLTMALTDTYTTNNANISGNATTFNDREFLVWGNNNASLDGTATTVTVDMSTDIGGGLVTEVEFTAIPRIWKVVETGGDIPSVEVSLPTSVVRTAAPPNGRYLMFISATGVFDPTADYRVMTETGGMLYADYDFDGTEYITFGWAPEREFVRSIYFDPVDQNYVDVEDHLDLDPTGFTISTWVNRGNASGNTAILSKRDAAFTEGYDLRFTPTGYLNARWRNSSGILQSITSSIVIPRNEWHHLAVIYDGTTATLYIDGVADTSVNRSAPAPTTQSFFIGAAGKNSPTAYFHGNIDEVRVWNTDLTVDQLRYIMNQEIQNRTSIVNGAYFGSRTITPTKNDVGTLDWSDLAGYYPMSTYTYTNTKDESGNGHQGALKNLRTVDYQTAPLPYISTQDGDWDDMNSWQNGNVQTIPGTSSIVDSDVSIDWNIVTTTHNITINDDADLPTDNLANRSVLALFIDSNELIVDGDNSAGTGYGLTVTHYLNLDGDIDLEGQSQLVQTADSDLEVASSGLLEKDQQGTRDFYTYDYWAAPVGISNITSNNNSYTLPDVLRNGTLPATPNAITFLTSGYDGNITGTDISIADYWIWKFANQLDDDYSAWQHVRSTGTLTTGEGYTMKGVEDTAGNVIFEQNYTFIGKPNNAGISLTLNAGNDYLVGNPYPSAIDAVQFITDNGPELDFTDPGGTPETDPLISGTLYFWDHWGGGSHNLAEYQGGYATYNYSGGVAAAAMGTNDPDVGTGGTPIYLPGRYIPVAKGFFVIGETTGTIDFNNGQRVYFNPDAPTSRSSFNSNPSYSANSEDLRMKLRIGFNSVNTLRRQLLVTVDENATPEIDYGFDGILYEDQMDDIYWMIEDEKFIIQGTDVIDELTVFPLGVKTQDDGMNSITIDSLVNAPEDIDVYVHDIELGLYHNLQESDYEFYLIAGEHLDRFEIVFTTGALSIDDNEINGVNVYYSNDIDSIVLVNPTNKDIRSIELLNILGQNVYSVKANTTSDYTEYKVSNLSTGTYIIKLNTLSGTISKKVLVE